MLSLYATEWRVDAIGIPLSCRIDINEIQYLPTERFWQLLNPSAKMAHLSKLIASLLQVTMILNTQCKQQQMKENKKVYIMVYTSIFTKSLILGGLKDVEVFILGCIHVTNFVSYNYS